MSRRIDEPTPIDRYRATNTRNLKRRRQAEAEREAEQNAGPAQLYSLDERRLVNRAVDALRAYDGGNDELRQLSDRLRRHGSLGRPTLAESATVYVLLSGKQSNYLASLRQWLANGKSLSAKQVNAANDIAAKDRSWLGHEDSAPTARDGAS